MINNEKNEALAWKMLENLQTDKIIILSLSHIMAKLITISTLYNGFSTFIINCMTTQTLNFSYWEAGDVKQATEIAKIFESLRIN